MPLLKNANATTVARDAMVLDLSDLRRRADEIIDRARQEAENVIRKGKEEARRIINDANRVGHEQGFARGLQEGAEVGRSQGREQVLQELRPQIERLIAKWSTAAEAFEADRRRMYLEAQQDVLSLALAIGRRIVHRVPHVDPTVVLDQVRAALALVLEPSAVSVVVAPDDRALVQQTMPALLEAFTACREIAIVEDATIERGGCVVRAGRGQIDASIQTQIERLVEALVPAPTTEAS